MLRTWSAPTSSAVKRQPRAPAFSSACPPVLAPGMGIVSLQISQFNATWPGVLPPCLSPIRRSSATIGSDAAERRHDGEISMHALELVEMLGAYAFAE